VVGVSSRRFSREVKVKRVMGDEEGRFGGGFNRAVGMVGRGLVG